MAQGFVSRCTACPKEIEAWDEGHPYYVNYHGKKVYVYHPDHERARCTEVEIDVICLDCGKEARSDYANPRTKCSKCGRARFRTRFSSRGVDVRVAKTGRLQWCQARS